ncbi:unnamed protein product, partial [Polarella glacialis]
GDGYVIDFGILKKAIRGVCAKLHTRTLLPTRSSVMKVEQSKAVPNHLEITCEGNVKMLIPAEDCVLVPIAHTTAEELGEYIWDEIMRSAAGPALVQRKVEWLEVTVHERVGQAASYRAAVSSFGSSKVLPSSHSAPRPCMQATSSEDEMQLSVTSTQMAVEPPPLPVVARTRSQQAEDMSPSAEAGFKQVLNACLGFEEASRPEMRKTPF